MKPVTITKLKEELKQYTEEELLEICLKLAKFKAENKELLTYLLFDSHDENAFLSAIKEEIDSSFSTLNPHTLYTVKKSVSKILRNVKKYIRYSKNKETEASLLIYFCTNMQYLKPAIKRSQQLINIYDRQLALAIKAISTLHEDIQYDYNLELEELERLQK